MMRQAFQVNAQRLRFYQVGFAAAGETAHQHHWQQ